MIVGTTAWETALAAQQKKPLYFLVLDDFQFYVLTFKPADENVSLTGAGYGAAYGLDYGDD